MFTLKTWEWPGDEATLGSNLSSVYFIYNITTIKLRTSRFDNNISYVSVHRTLVYSVRHCTGSVFNILKCIQFCQVNRKRYMQLVIIKPITTVDYVQLCVQNAGDSLASAGCVRLLPHAAECCR